MPPRRLGPVANPPSADEIAHARPGCAVGERLVQLIPRRTFRQQSKRVEAQAAEWGHPQVSPSDAILLSEPGPP